MFLGSRGRRSACSTCTTSGGALATAAGTAAGLTVVGKLVDGRAPAGDRARTPSTRSCSGSSGFYLPEERARIGAFGRRLAPPVASVSAGGLGRAGCGRRRCRRRSVLLGRGAAHAPWRARAARGRRARPRPRPLRREPRLAEARGARSRLTRADGDRRVDLRPLAALVTPLVALAAPFRPPLSSAASIATTSESRARGSSVACCRSTASSARRRSRSAGTRYAAE